MVSILPSTLYISLLPETSRIVVSVVPLGELVPALIVLALIVTPKLFHL